MVYIAWSALMTQWKSVSCFSLNPDFLCLYHLAEGSGIDTASSIDNVKAITIFPTYIRVIVLSCEGIVGHYPLVCLGRILIYNNDLAIYIENTFFYHEEVKSDEEWVVENIMVATKWWEPCLLKLWARMNSNPRGTVWYQVQLNCPGNFWEWSYRHSHEDDEREN